MHKFLPRTLLVTALSLALAAPSANAQDVIPQYDPDYRPDYDEEIVDPLQDELYITSEIIPTILLNSEFVRLPEAAPNEMTLRFTASGTITGCLEIVQPTAEVDYRGRTARVEITEGRMNVNDDDTSYTHHDCEVKTGAPTLDITLNRDTLMAQDIQKILISSKALGSLINYKVDTNKNRSILVAPIQTLLQMGQDPTNGKNITTYWYYPENTVILYNPSLRLNDIENIKKLVAYAKRRGLVPLTDMLPDFRVSAQNRHKMYFVDVDGAYAAQMQNVDDVTTLGNVEMTEIVHGANGPEEKTVETPIYLKRPGLYE